jgi:hypothetical protein
MRLLKLAQFRKLVYAEGSAPTIATLRKRILEIPGGRIEFGRYYVHIDKHDQATDFRSGLDARREKLRRELVERGLI